MTHEIEISYFGVSRNDTFNAVLVSTGELLASKVSNPEAAAAKILAERGYSGAIETRWRGSDTASMRLAIKAAMPIAA